MSRTFTLAAAIAISSLGLTSFSAPAQEYSGLGAASVAPEVLEKFRPAPLPADISRRIQSMMDLQSAAGGVLSADGRHLYFNWRITGVSQVWRMDGPGAFPVQMTGGEDATTVRATTRDGRWLVIQRDRKGEENPGLYLQPVNGGPLKLIRHQEGVQTFYQFGSDDGRFLFFTANDRKRDSRALYRYELATGTIEPVVTEPGLWHVADHRPDGTLLLEKALGSHRSEFHEWREGKFTPIIAGEEAGDYSFRFAREQGAYFVVTPRFGEWRRLYRFAGGQWQALTGEVAADVAEFRLNQNRSRILYTLNEGGYSRTRALDGRTGKALPFPAFAGADHVLPGPTTRDGRYTVLSVETAQTLRATQVLDWKTGKTVPWLLPATPEIDTSRFARATLEHYPARDGTAIPMFVRRPAVCKPAPCPVLVYFHGGPEGQSKPGFSAAMQIYVDAGYVVVEPNVRGSDGYGKTWFHADDGPRRLDVISDIEDAALYIRKAWAVDGKAPRVGVFGGSYGGYATLMAMTRFAGAYDAGVSNVGISNLLTFLNNTAPYRRKLRINEYGDPEKDRDALIALSPTTYADRLQAPLLIIQGASDPRVPVGESVQMYEAAKTRGVPSELMIFADEGHGAQKRDNRALTIGHTLRFFDRYLKKP